MAGEVLKRRKNQIKIMLRAIKVRLYPNKRQTENFSKLLGCCRVVYNDALVIKKKAYDEDKTSLGLKELSKWLHGEELKNEEKKWLNEQNTKILKQELRHLLDAYQRFFNENNGFPKFKKRNEDNSATFPYGAISRKNTFETRHISLTQQFKNVRFECSNLYWNRLQKYKQGIRSATLTRTKSGRFFLSILVDIPQDELVKFKKTGKHAGADRGVKDFVITSDGKIFPNKKFFQKIEKQIKRLQKQASRKQKGSNNQKKAYIKIAKKHEHATWQKEAYIHEVVNSLLQCYDLICIEDLYVKGMLKNHHLAKAIQQVSFGRFARILTDKAHVNGKEVVKVGRFFPSSKTCSHCNYVLEKLPLSVREWTCPHCGAKNNRDINAAINILYEGKRIIGLRVPEFKPDGEPNCGALSLDGASSGSLKQEANSKNHLC